jgi:hypothetical protein
MIKKLIQRLKTKKIVTNFDIYTIENKKHFVKIK